MITIHSNAVAISHIANDLVLMEVRHEDISHNVFDYEIRDASERVVRRGRFTGPLVQLGTQFLGNGIYQVDLMVKGKTWRTISFTKNTF